VTYDAGSQRYDGRRRLGVHNRCGA
jgi:hypothetical protein